MAANGAYYSLVIRDITERKTNEEKISSLVYLDSLTGLPNRRLFNDRLGSAIDQAIDNDRDLSVLYLDLDQFKLINDTMDIKPAIACWLKQASESTHASRKPIHWRGLAAMNSLYCC